MKAVGQRELEELAHLLFEWPIKQAPRLALPMFILLAAVIQAGMTVLFSINYGPPVEMQPAAPQVYFLPPESAVSRQLAPWLEANDPAVFSPQHAAKDALPAPPPLNYRPSYEEPPPPLHPLPPVAEKPLEPPTIPLGTGAGQRWVEGGLAKQAGTAAALAPPALTVVRWQDELAGRVASAEASMSPPTPVSPTQQPSLYEVEVSPEGIPLHCFLLESSGDAAGDETGRVWILAQRLPPSEQSSWGRTLIQWGAPRSAPVQP
jgi:hypothetical protein